MNSKGMIAVPNTVRKLAVNDSQYRLNLKPLLLPRCKCCRGMANLLDAMANGQTR